MYLFIVVKKLMRGDRLNTWSKIIKMTDYCLPVEYNVNITQQSSPHSCHSAQTSLIVRHKVESKYLHYALQFL